SLLAARLFPGYRSNTRPRTRGRQKTGPATRLRGIRHYLAYTNGRSAGSSLIRRSMMFGTKRVVIAVLFALATVAVPTARADDEKGKGKKPAEEPAKPIIIQLDASKLPPEVLKELLKLSKASEPTKPVKPEAKPE